MNVEYLGNKELLKLKKTAFLASNTIFTKIFVTLHAKRKKI